MDDDICAMEELAATEWRAGRRVEVPLVYEIKAETEKTPEEEAKKQNLPEITPQGKEACVSSKAMDEDLKLKRSHKDIMRRVSERYKTECLPYSKPPKFPEFPPTKPSREMEIVGALRPNGVRFIHYPENYADCVCFIPPQLMNYFEQRSMKLPVDRFDEDYFGDVNFQKFLRGLTDQFSLLHHSRTFTVVGFSSKTWYTVTYNFEIREQSFKDRSKFVAALKSRIEEAHSDAWSRSFLMCPCPYPKSFVVPLREKDENILLQYTYQNSLVLTSSPELQREADPISELETTFDLDESFNSSAPRAQDELFEKASFDEVFKKNRLFDSDSSSGSGLAVELPVDSSWLETSFESSDEDAKSQEDSAEYSGTIGDFFSIEDTVEDEVFFCLQEILAAVLSECKCPQHRNREVFEEGFLVSEESSTIPAPDLVPTPCLEPTRNDTFYCLDSFETPGPQTSSMVEFDLIVTEGTAPQNGGDQQLEAQTSLLDIIDTEQLQAAELKCPTLSPILQPELIIVKEYHRSPSADETGFKETGVSTAELDPSHSLQCRVIAEQSTANPPDSETERASEVNSADPDPGVKVEPVQSPTSRRPGGDSPFNSEIELTPSGASFRITSPRRCISLPSSGLRPSREESLFLADTIAKLRPFGVRFLADLRSYEKCSCRPCSAIAKLWKRSERLNVDADFDMDQFGDMLLAHLIAARNGSAALLLHYAGSFDLIKVDRNQWTYVHDDCGDAQSQTFGGEEALFSLVERRISRKFNSQTLLEKFMCPLPEGMVQNDATSSILKRTLKVREDMKANMAKKLTTLENQKDILGKKFASFMTRLGH